MPVFRLFNIVSLRVEEFELFQNPPYIAASHAWIECSFADSSDGFNGSFGGQAIQAVAQQVYPELKYCWIDRLCINQRDIKDKMTQIPLMEHIFRQAEAVVIVLKTNLGIDQDHLNQIATGLEDLVQMYEQDEYEELGGFWQYGPGRSQIVQAMTGLTRLSSTTWASRVWTMQEFILAKEIYWVGLELQPIQFSDSLLIALPDACDTLAIDECLVPEMRAVFSYLYGMATVRMGKIERTRVMELSGNRNTKKPADAVYGAMSASGVVIQPVVKESKFAAWRRWCETALIEGHIRWMLLPRNGQQPNEAEQTSCVFPYFDNRHLMSASSGLDTVAALGPVSVVDGRVTVSARELGTLKIVKRLGHVHEDRLGRLQRDITLILFGEGNKQLCLQIASAFSGGKYSPSETGIIAKILYQNYILAASSVVSKNENNFRPSLRGESQLSLWTDFMGFQQSHMVGLNEGTGYLCEVLHTSSDSPLVTVLVTGESLPDARLEVLDFEANTPSEFPVLMVVAKDADSTNLHKAGMTLPVTNEFSSAWATLPLVNVSIGGDKCIHCKATESLREAPQSKEPPTIPDDSAESLKRARGNATRAIRKQFRRMLRQSPATRSSSQVFRRRRTTNVIGKPKPKIKRATKS